MIVDLEVHKVCRALSHEFRDKGCGVDLTCGLWREGFWYRSAVARCEDEQHLTEAEYAYERGNDVAVDLSYLARGSCSGVN